MALWRPVIWLKKLAIVSHRWTGAAFCLLFSWWFISGVFIMYCDYPEVKRADRLARAEALDASRIRLSAREAWGRLQSPGAPDSVRLAMFDRRPAYWFRLGRARLAVYADNGETQRNFPPDINLRTAAAFAGEPAEMAKVEAVTQPDQWTVGGIYRRGARLTKYSWPDGRQAYVSGATGEVVQYTTRAIRLGAWLGPIPHWLYFTALRQNGRLWSKIVIWLSGAATLVAVLGLIAGLTMYSPSKRYRFEGSATSNPYAGTKRLHMTLGLFFGLLACTWAFSGMLSMDPFPQSGSGGSEFPEAFSGEPFDFEPFDEREVQNALAQVAGLKVKDLEFLNVGGKAFYLATQDERNSRVIPMDGEARSELDRAWLVDVVNKASRPQGLDGAEFITAYDAYYLDRRRELPLPVLRVRLNDASQSIFYVDPRTARIVGGYDKSQWAERWAYHGLHSMNLPWLYRNRPAWDLVVLTLMLGGAALSVTSVVIGAQFVRRKLP
jgi:PepSY-associated TM region